MILSADVKGLEVVCAAFLSNDKVLRQEILDGVDIHGENQKAFGFPDRLGSKRFKFKMIYGGSAPGFANDPDFRFLKWSVKDWEDVIEDYYSKYVGMKSWHHQLVDGILSTGFYTSVSGRKYDFREMIQNKPDWFYVPKMKNYPVQGLGADVVQMSRISIYKRLKEGMIPCKLINTVHDSNILDFPAELEYNIRKTVDSVYSDLPNNLSLYWKCNWSLPLSVEYKQLGVINASNYWLSN